MDDFKPQQPQKQDDLSSEKPNDFQAAYDEKPETYVTPSGEPTTIEATQQPSLAMLKKKGGAGKWLLVGVVVLLLAGAGALAYWQWNEAGNARSEVASLQTALKAAQDASKKEQADKTDEKPTAKAPTDKELVTKEVESLLAAAQNNQFVVQDANVKVEGMFAVVTAVLPNSDAGGKTVVLEKAKDAWVVLYSGVAGGIPTEDKNMLIKDYGVPEALLQ